MESCATPACSGSGPTSRPPTSSGKRRDHTSREVLFPPADGEAAITKGELAAYDGAIASLMIPHVRGIRSPWSAIRVGSPRKGFIQKDVSKGYPDWLERVEVPKKDGTVHHPLVSDTRSLLWVDQSELHRPHVWSSRTPNLYQPDLCIFDLDPAAEDFEVLGAATLALRDLLDELGLPSWVKTSGSKAFTSWCRSTGRPVSARSLHSRMRSAPSWSSGITGHLTQEFHKVDRAGRILVDTARNGYGATFAAAYAVRARTGARVSAPCTWAEVESGTIVPRTFNLRNMAARVSAVGDLWKDMRRRGRSLRRAADRLRKL